MRIQLLLEEQGVATFSRDSAAISQAVDTLDLELRVDPRSALVSASYSINAGALQDLAEVAPPPEFFSFDAAGIDPAIGTRSFTGVFASHRNGPAPGAVRFDTFSLRADAVGQTSAALGFSRSSHALPTPTALAWGPDDRLYALELFGAIHALRFDPSGAVIADETISSLVDALGPRLSLGLAVDPSSTPQNVVLWVSSSSPSLNNGIPNSGVVSRLSGTDFRRVDHVITGLPRAVANHGTNSIRFGPDGRLFIAQGGNTGAGAPNLANSEFGSFEEQPLSAALLVADVKSSFFDGSCDNPAGLFETPLCDVEVYSSGLRNLYDFVHHSNGKLYGPDNGLGVTGTFPPEPTPPCLGLANPAPVASGGDNPGTQPDLLMLLKQGRSYGHPNPRRSSDPNQGECVFKDGSLQGVAPPSHFETPLADLGDHRSTNGIVEYPQDVGCVQTSGNLFLANFSVGDDLTRVVLSPAGNSVERMESAVGGFSNPLPLATAPDGRIFVGEFGSNRVTTLVPESLGCWSVATPLPVDRLDAGGTALDGRVYVVAGKDPAGPKRSLFVYAPGLDQWSRGADLPGPGVENPAVVGHDGKLFVFGGSTGPFSGAVTNAASYDPSTHLWSVLPPMGTARGGATAGVVGNRIYVVGGMDGTGASLASGEAFDPTSQSWAPIASMGERRDNPGSGVANGWLYVFGGRTRNTGGGVVDGSLASMEAYDPVADRWIGRASMPTGRRAFLVGRLNGRFQAMGGEASGTGSGTYVENEEYDPSTDTWKPIHSMPLPRHGGVAATVDGWVYTVGGGPSSGSSYSAVNDVFAF